jgi:transposase
VKQSAPWGYLGGSATSPLLVSNTRENHSEIAGHVTAVVNRLFGNRAIAHCLGRLRRHRQLSAEAGDSLQATPKAPREFDQELYKARHLIENFFCKLKQFRAIATRYDKTARNFLAAIHLAAAIVWLNWRYALGRNGVNKSENLRLLGRCVLGGPLT